MCASIMLTKAKMTPHSVMCFLRDLRAVYAVDVADKASSNAYALIIDPGIFA